MVQGERILVKDELLAKPNVVTSWVVESIKRLKRVFNPPRAAGAGNQVSVLWRGSS